MNAQPPVVYKNPGIAAVLSFFYTGLGQIYNGQIAKGIAFMVIQGINIVLMFVLIGFFTYFVFWIYGMYDAYQTAQKMNMGMSGRVG
jgi:TM2 domain-containing membrane protein YozV